MSNPRRRVLESAARAEKKEKMKPTKPYVENGFYCEPQNGPQFYPLLKLDDEVLNVYSICVHDDDWTYERRVGYGVDPYYVHGSQKKQTFGIFTKYIFMGYVKDTDEILFLCPNGKIYPLPSSYANRFYRIVPISQ
jgi:hypothetical protein